MGILRHVSIAAIVALALVALVATSPAHADTLVLTGTIRDFMDTHIDFQHYLGVDPGIVDQALGADKKPVYGTHDRTLTTSGKAYFDQWFRDVPGVNMSAPYAITLANTPATPDVYTFSSGAFFPIDNQLFGNQGRAHNFHFTYELHTSFTYETGQFFTFTGDDDLWVYIDNWLVIDLGGVHSGLTGSVDLDTLGLTVGRTYDLDIFYAERHTSEADFRIDTSIVLVPAATPTPTASASPTATRTATPTATARATATPTPAPTSLASCVCPIVYKRVPAVVIADAVANPQRYYGWRYPLDLGKPPSPANPPRECLTLLNVNIDYHPVWNKPVWRVGCP
jgi:fibro-slime domain-containing protein